MVVSDASALVIAVASTTAQGDAVMARLRDGVVAPHVIDAEVGAALRRLVLRRELDEYSARRSLHHANLLVTRRLAHGPLSKRAWDLRENVSFYDALFVAAAEAWALTLVTADRRLAAASGPRCSFEVVTATASGRP